MTTNPVRPSLRRWVLLAAVTALVVTSATATADPITDTSGFSGDQTVVDFDAVLPYSTAITNQYAGDGVTFTNLYSNSLTGFSFSSAQPHADNFSGSSSPFPPASATFSEPVVRVGMEIITNPGATTLRAYLDGDLVDAQSFPTDNDATPEFIGLDVPGGFDMVVIDASATINGALVIDSFMFEGNALPESFDDCKKGGWQNYGGKFKNQGDCVSFVATGGRNGPTTP